MPGTQSKDNLVVDNIYLANRLAYKAFKQMPPWIDLDDVKSEALIGLVQAAQRFDPAKGANFQTFATIRIKGAILDFQRSEDTVSRQQRKQIKQGTLLTQQVTIEQWPVTENGDDVEFPDCKPDTLQDFNIDLIKALAKLTDREKRVLVSYFFEGIPMHQIGKQEGICESRISQLMSAIINKLRGIMGNRVTNWNELLGHHAIELIEQAHKDAKAGLHMSVTISNVVCVCGCDTYLPSTLANRGWRYHHGHKPKQTHNGSSLVSTPRKPHTDVKLATPTIVNMPVIDTYFQGCLKLVRDQLTEKRQIMNDTRKIIDHLIDQETKLLTAVKAIEALHG